MNFLSEESAVVDRFCPGLIPRLSATHFADLESPSTPVFQIFKETGGPGLLVPSDCEGLGATASDALKFQVYVSSLAPSLGIAVAMHHWSVVTLAEIYTLFPDAANERKWLQDIARDNLLVASGFSEGKPAASFLNSSLKVEAAPGGLYVSGSKKPCSMARSMDVLAIGTLLNGHDHTDPEVTIMMVPASAGGIRVMPFWKSSILLGTQSEEVVLDRVFVEDGSISRVGNPKYLNLVQTRCLAWFELLISAAYLGAAASLVRDVLSADRGPVSERVRLLIEIEGSIASLEGIAASLMHGPDFSDASMARAILARFSVQNAITRIVSLALELLGGTAFVTTAKLAYLAATGSALAFHPPSRTSVSETLARFYRGEPFERTGW